MTTAATHTHPEISWTLGEYVDENFYQAIGESEDGRKWSGTASTFFKEIVEVEEIEEILN